MQLLPLSVYNDYYFVMFMLQEIKKGTIITPFEFWEFFTVLFPIQTMGKEIAIICSRVFIPIWRQTSI